MFGLKSLKKASNTTFSINADKSAEEIVKFEQCVPPQMNGHRVQILTAENRRFDRKSLELTFMKTYGHFCIQCMRIDDRRIA